MSAIGILDAMRIEYSRDTSGRLFWCNAHGRRATHVRTRHWPEGNWGWLGDQAHVCEPGLGGIMIPCQVVDLTDLAEIDV